MVDAVACETNIFYAGGLDADFDKACGHGEGTGEEEKDWCSHLAILGVNLCRKGGKERGSGGGRDLNKSPVVQTSHCVPVAVNVNATSRYIITCVTYVRKRQVQNGPRTATNRVFALLGKRD